MSFFKFIIWIVCHSVVLWYDFDTIYLLDSEWTDYSCMIVNSHNPSQVRWDRISSGSNVTHAVVLKPITPGGLNYTSAVISYHPTEDASEPRYATTTAPGEGNLLCCLYVIVLLNGKVKLKRAQQRKYTLFLLLSWLIKNSKLNSMILGYIYRERDYDRKFSPHYSDWGVFLMMALPCIGLPGLLWFKTYKQYDVDTKKKY